MCLRTPRRDELTSHAHRKRNVHRAVDVHVTDFATIDAKLEPPKSMGEDLDTRPFSYRGFETARDVLVSDDASCECADDASRACVARRIFARDARRKVFQFARTIRVDAPTTARQYS